MNESKTVLVTGSSGFIGSEVCRQLLDKGYKVLGVDSFVKYGNIKRSHDDHPNFKLYRIDLENCCGLEFPQTNIDHLLNISRDNDIDYIIHCAALIGGIELFHTRQADILRTNERINANVFDFALECHQVGILKKIVVLSSSMVFENTDVFPTPESALDQCRCPSSTYGMQKLMCEFFAKGYNQQYGLPYVIVRPFNASGVGEEDFISGKKSHVIPDLIIKCLNTNGDLPLPILGDGNQVRCYTAVQDIAKGIIMSMSSDIENDDFNISTPVATTVVELAELIWRKIYPDKPFRYVSEKPFDYDVQRRVPDVSKAERILGFTADIPLDKSVDDVIDHIRSRIGVKNGNMQTV